MNRPLPAPAPVPIAAAAAARRALFMRYAVLPPPRAVWERLVRSIDGDDPALN